MATSRKRRGGLRRRLRRSNLLLWVYIALLAWSPYLCFSVGMLASRTGTDGIGVLLYMAPAALLFIMIELTVALFAGGGTYEN